MTDTVAPSTSHTTSWPAACVGRGAKVHGVAAPLFTGGTHLAGANAGVM